MAAHLRVILALFQLILPFIQELLRTANLLELLLIPSICEPHNSAARLVQGTSKNTGRRQICTGMVGTRWAVIINAAQPKSTSLAAGSRLLADPSRPN